jgi:hypothetical protein
MNWGARRITVDAVMDDDEPLTDPKIKLVHNRLNDLGQDVLVFEDRMERRFVTHQRLMTWAGAVLGAFAVIAVGLAAWTVKTASEVVKDGAAATGREVDSVRSDLFVHKTEEQQQIQGLRNTMEANQNRTDTKLDRVIFLLRDEHGR